MLKIIKKASILLFILLFFSNSIAFANNNIKAKHAETKQKIQKLKLLEKIETNKLYKNQQKLEENRRDLSVNTRQYETAQSRLNGLEAQLSSLMEGYNELQSDASHRIRQIFKHQRKSYVEFLLSSKDFNTMLDRLYFENLVTKTDKMKLNQIKQKARSIAQVKADIEREKRFLASSINDMSYQQKEIQRAINQNEAMIERIKTDRRAFERSERELARQSEAISNMIVRTVEKDDSVKVTTGFMWPIRGPITSPFGYRIHPIFKSRTFHSGLDIGGPMGMAIKASNGGKVIYAGWYGGYGKVAIIDHGRYSGKSLSTLYAHQSSYNVYVGQSIAKGQTIGRVGSTGYSTGPHLHFEVRVDGKVQNPLSYLR